MSLPTRLCSAPHPPPCSIPPSFTPTERMGPYILSWWPFLCLHGQVRVHCSTHCYKSSRTLFIRTLNFFLITDCSFWLVYLTTIPSQSPQSKSYGLYYSSPSKAHSTAKVTKISRCPTNASDPANPGSNRITVTELSSSIHWRGTRYNNNMSHKYKRTQDNNLWWPVISWEDWFPCVLQSLVNTLTMLGPLIHPKFIIQIQEQLWIHFPISPGIFFSKLPLRTRCSSMLQSSLLLFNWASGNKNILTFNNVTNLGRDSRNRLPTQRATTLTGEGEGMKSETNNICSLPKMLCFRILPKNPILVTQIVQSSKTNKQQ